MGKGEPRWWLPRTLVRLLNFKLWKKVDMEKPPMLLNPSVLELDPMATNVSTSFRPVSIIRSKVVVVSQSFLAGVGI